MAIEDGKIIEIGEDDRLLAKYDDESTRKINAQDKFIMPGLIEGHGHFHGVGEQEIRLNFLRDTSWNDIVAKVKKAANKSPDGSWIIGRGWHQEKLTDLPLNNVDGYPRHDLLSAAAPDHPVLLTHASGHGIIVNQRAMDMADVSQETADPLGGRIVRDRDGNAIGVFEERAMYAIRTLHTDYENSRSEEERYAEWMQITEKAQMACLAYGITSFQDAGSPDLYIKRYKDLADRGKLKIKLWAMLRQPWSALDTLDLSDYPVYTDDNYFTCAAIKSELDGALGSYGAWLLRPYSDKNNFHGQNTTTVEEVKNIAQLCKKKSMQCCVHAIGDRANRVLLDVYEGVLADQIKSDHRWRVEHAQHLAVSDIPRFAAGKFIASMQGIHCTSDAPFVVDRLGVDRAQKGAYAWRALLDSGTKIANGTDAPVESLNPFESIYASIARKRPDGSEAFFPEQSMTRIEALQSYTSANAYAAKEENIKGRLAPGLAADFIILDRDLESCPIEDIPDTEVEATYIDGELRYTRTE